MSTHGTDSKTKFFHAMVLMGGSIALGCGGLAEKPGGDNTVGSGGSTGNGGSDGSVGSGGTNGSGGRTIGSGGLVVGSGGVASGGTDSGPIEPGPFACPPAQWECEGLSTCSGDGYTLPDDCPCNTAGPTSPSDCPVGEQLGCLSGTQNARGQTFTHPVPFNCQCVPEKDYCGAACDKLGVPGAQCTHVSEEDPTILCDCAVVILR